VEWQPFERILTQDLLPIPVPNTYALIECRLEPAENGTRLIQSFGKASGPFLGRILYSIGVRMKAKQWQKDIESFKKQVEAEFMRQLPGQTDQR
jgi:hypothetical protein